MLKVGLTGGIASGKSSACKFFSELNIDVIDADEVARTVVQPGSSALQAIANKFGHTILTPQGKLDRDNLRKIIFADQNKRIWLENLLHPLIKNEIHKQSLKIQSPYCIIAIPLLVESNSQDMVDRVLVIDCSEADQLKRLQQRDDIDAIQAKKMLASQASRQQRLAIADDVVLNDGSIEQLKQIIAEHHSLYLSLAKR